MDDECPSFKGGLLLPPPSKTLEASRMTFFFKDDSKLVSNKARERGKLDKERGRVLQAYRGNLP